MNVSIPTWSYSNLTIALTVTSAPANTVSIPTWSYSNHRIKADLCRYAMHSFNPNMVLF